jgi:hypothetical protein
MLQSHGYKLSAINMILSDNKQYDIKGITSEFTIFESIDAPSVRAEFLIADATDFISNIYGNEIIELELVTDSDASVSYKLKQRIYKIGSNVKNERMQMYVLHTVSEEAITNERVRVFKTFKQTAANTVVAILKDYLNTDKKVIVENTQSTFPFICPSWRPYDAIAYLTDKSVRVGREKVQSCFMFFENRDGIHYESIDALVEKSQNKTPSGNVVKGLLTGQQAAGSLKKFTYAQKNVGTTGDNYYSIQRVTYPDKYDIINQMRSGALGNSIIGIDPLSINQSALPSTSKSSSSETANAAGPGGGEYLIGNKSADKYWKEFSHVDESNPYAVAMKFLKPGEGQRKRLKFIAGSGFDNASGGTITPNAQTANQAATNTSTSTSSLTQGTTNKGGAAAQPKQILESALYSLMRYQAASYIKLNIVVPGNVGVTVGDVIEVELPAANESNKSLPIESTYSGYYLVLGVVHVWRPEGVTTNIDIGRDSVKKY